MPITKIQKISNLIDRNSVCISNVFNCYSENISGMWKAWKLGGKLKKTFDEFTLT